MPIVGAEKSCITSVCITCRMRLPRDFFGVRKDGMHRGISYKCKLCTSNESCAWKVKNPERHNEAQKRYYQRHPDRISARRLKNKKWTKEYSLLRLYGLTLAAFEAMEVAQAYCCAICKRHKDICKRGYLVVDHDHVTGKVRALLCIRCNSGIGTFNEDANLLSLVAEYVRNGGVK